MHAGQTGLACPLAGDRAAFGPTRGLRRHRVTAGILAWQKLGCYTRSMINDDVAGLPDETLLTQTSRAAADERRMTVHLIALLGELDARRLYLGEGCSSLFTYCTRVLHLSEHAAYGRIEAARGARRCPEILPRLADGSLTLTAVCLVAPHLTPENQATLLDAVRHRSKRDIEQIVAAVRPQPPVPSVVRKLPARKAPPSSSLLPLGVVAGTDSSRAPGEPAPRESIMRSPTSPAPDVATARVTAPPPPRATISPLAPDRYKVQFTVSRETYEKLREAQDLLRHAIPNGDLAEIFGRALRLLLDDLARRKYAAVHRPRTPPNRRDAAVRGIPADVRRSVWARDDGRCAFVAANGRRCGERGFLEFHHLVPYADGGEATLENIELRCRGHNAYEADLWFGSRIVVERDGESTA